MLDITQSLFTTVLCFIVVPPSSLRPPFVLADCFRNLPTFRSTYLHFVVLQTESVFPAGDD